MIEEKIILSTLEKNRILEFFGSKKGEAILLAIKGANDEYSRKT